MNLLFNESKEKRLRIGEIVLKTFIPGVENDLRKMGNYNKHKKLIEMFEEQNKNIEKLGEIIGMNPVHGSSERIGFYKNNKTDLYMAIRFYSEDGLSSIPSIVKYEMRAYNKDDMLYYLNEVLRDNFSKDKYRTTNYRDSVIEIVSNMNK